MSHSRYCRTVNASMLSDIIQSRPSKPGVGSATVEREDPYVGMRVVCCKRGVKSKGTVVEKLPPRKASPYDGPVYVVLLDDGRRRKAMDSMFWQHFSYVRSLKENQ